MTTTAPDVLEVIETTDDISESVTPSRWSRLRQLWKPTEGPQRPPVSPGARLAAWVLLMIIVLAVWFISYALVLSGIQQQASQRMLFAQLREELALATAPVGGAIEPGAPIALISAPTAGIDDEVVVEGTSSAQTRSGPGHRPDTPLPGQPGVSLLYGRSVTFGGVFADLSQMAPGDTIEVTTGQGELSFTVDGVRRPGDPLPPPPDAAGSRLTLVSAEGTGRLQSLVASSVVFVDATLDGEAQPAPPGRPTSISDDERLMSGDTSALVPLVLWLEVLLLAVVVLVWARARWGTWQTWVVGVPIVIAVGWAVTSTAFVLLPNVL